MKKKFYWGVIILSWIFILSSCSQEKCEDELLSQYIYRVELLNSDSTILDVRFCDFYFREYNDSLTTFTYKYCDRGRVKTEVFKSQYYLIY